MKCPFCANFESKVVDSRSIDENTSIRRRRECLACAKRFTTYEKMETIPLIVVKKDGRRELFDETKLLGGLIKAFEKRPVAIDKIKGLAEKIERDLRQSGDSEIPSETIGELVMKYIAEVDQIAYVRFASVYRQFADIDNFMHELQNIIKKGNDTGSGEKKNV